MKGLERVSCPCCTGENLLRLGKLPDSLWFAGRKLEKPIDGGELYRCQHCSLKFRHPVQDAGVYDLLYDNTATSTWPADTERKDWDLIIQHIREQRPNGGRVLDFGCFVGGLLDRLGPAYRRYGVEVNRAAAAVATRKISGYVWSSIDDIPGDLRFDVVVASDLIEHIRDPRDLIQRLVPLVTDGGLLIITTGDADNPMWNRFGANWWYCFYPEHIAFLSRPWLDYACKGSGLTLIHCDTFRYCNRGPGRNFMHWALTWWYGLRPASYLFFAGIFRRISGRPSVSSVTGNGVSRDHLFIVLSKTE